MNSLRPFQLREYKRHYACSSRKPTKGLHAPQRTYITCLSPPSAPWRDFRKLSIAVICIFYLPGTWTPSTRAACCTVLPSRYLLAVEHLAQFLRPFRLFSPCSFLLHCPGSSLLFRPRRDGFRVAPPSRCPSGSSGCPARSSGCVCHTSRCQRDSRLARLEVPMLGSPLQRGARSDSDGGRNSCRPGRGRKLVPRGKCPRFPCLASTIPAWRSLLPFTAWHLLCAPAGFSSCRWASGP